MGVVFENKKTGERVIPTFWFHFKYFFLMEELKLFIVIVVCFTMSICLIFFVLYHFRLIMDNQTTNESFKRYELKKSLGKERESIIELIKEAREWQPETSN